LAGSTACDKQTAHETTLLTKQKNIFIGHWRSLLPPFLASQKKKLNQGLLIYKAIICLGIIPSYSEKVNDDEMLRMM